MMVDPDVNDVDRPLVLLMRCYDGVDGVDDPDDQIDRRSSSWCR